MQAKVDNPKQLRSDKLLGNKLLNDGRAVAHTHAPLRLRFNYTRSRPQRNRLLSAISSLIYQRWLSLSLSLSHDVDIPREIPRF